MLVSVNIGIEFAFLQKKLDGSQNKEKGTKVGKFFQFNNQENLEAFIYKVDGFSSLHTLNQQLQGKRYKCFY